MVHDFTVHTGLGHVWSSKIQGEICDFGWGKWIIQCELKNLLLVLDYERYLIISAENVIPFQFLKSEFKNLSNAHDNRVKSCFVCSKLKFQQYWISDFISVFILLILSSEKKTANQLFSPFNNAGIWEVIFHLNGQKFAHVFWQWKFTIQAIDF